MAIDFPASPTEGQVFTPSGAPGYVYHAPAWELVPGASPASAVLYVPQSLSDAQQVQSRTNIEAALISAQSYNNMIINGSFRINQEFGDDYYDNGWMGYNYFIQDQWYISTAVASPGSADLNLGIDVPPGAPPFGAAYRGCFTAQMTGAGIPSPGANNYITLAQTIEYTRFKKLSFGHPAAKPVTVSFWLLASKTGTMCVYLGSGGGIDGWRGYWQEVVIAAANTWQYVTLTFPPDTLAPLSWGVSENAAGAYLYFTMMAGASRKLQTAGSWQTWTGDATAAQTNFFSTVNDKVCIVGVTMLPGTQAPSAAASPLLQRPYGDEYALCQRYYQRLGFVLGAGGAPWETLTFPTSMRGYPTISASPSPAGFTVPAVDNDHVVAYGTSGISTVMIMNSRI